MDLITPSFGLIFWQTIIFLLMLFILGKFAWKPIINFIETREKYIETSLETAKKIRNEMYHLQFYKEHWIKESNIQRDILIREARNMSNLIRLDSLQKKKIYKKKFFLQVKCMLEKEKEAAKADIKNNIAHLAIDISKTLLGKELKKKKEQEYIIFNLIDNYLNAIDQVRSFIY
jgi:F-type H+-transporting ATPase subunit b